MIVWIIGPPRDFFANITIFVYKLRLVIKLATVFLLYCIKVSWNEDYCKSSHGVQYGQHI